MSENTFMQFTRWEKLTYGLIYPAFIGNMIYDLVLFFIDKKNLLWADETLGITTALVIIFFYALDYVHLSIDLEKYVEKVGKSWKYISGDIASSFLFFLAFVASKYGHPGITLGLIGLVPIVFAFYNIELKKHVLFHKIYAGVSVTLLSVFGLLLHTSKIITVPTHVNAKEIAVTIIVCLLFAVYFLYNLLCFWLEVFNSKPKEI